MLTDTAIKRLKAKESMYRVADQHGLCLELAPTGSKLWRYRYRYAGKPSMLSLGRYPEVSLADARMKAAELRATLRQGDNPAQDRRIAKSAQRESAANTFQAVAQEWLSKQVQKMSEKTLYKACVQLSLPIPTQQGGKRKLQRPHLPDAFRSAPIRALGPTDVLAVLRPIEARNELDTAHRIKQRIGQVFGYAIATGRADRDPTRDLRGALSPVVSTSRAAVTKPADISRLMQKIAEYDGADSVRLALQFSALVFQRPGSIRLMEWAEIDWDAREWRIPAAKMKMREEHLVPLSTQALALLRKSMPFSNGEGYVFPSRFRNRPMSDGTMNAALRRMGFDGNTMVSHGFRAMASTRLNELGWPPDVIERQLAHVERNKVRAAYNRAQYMEERRKMMQAWADYLDRAQSLSTS
ncbi:tyrosine-type recombinase/integrase [Xanthomonas euvesicatoria]|uniref:tyrosine-type recombinase/integrase n=1 Tax=Xanthomonas euvesicatoria TaxID=456327 RepID=UPI00160B508B|nr:integrase arm-type DNA-binding domain-containing protein [Xanthomonas euvesicatoria]MBV6829681.1 tyrosine-type recombinase/integrase [Xanthomonas campestris pv. viegasii]